MRNRIVVFLAAGLMLLASCGTAPVNEGEDLPASPEQQNREYGTLLWSDEFDGDTLDTAKWRPMLGTGPEEGYPDYWGNQEEQYYRAENAVVTDGQLAIKIRREDHKGMSYTSSRITTSELFSFTYGRVEARIKLPEGYDGIWPAFWMLPDGNPDQWPYGTWAASGEIDIMENRSRLPGEISGAAHFGGRWPDNTYKHGGYTFPEGTSASEWHVYSLEWYPDKMIWAVDDSEYFRLESWHTDDGSNKSGPPEPFDEPFCLIINAAVGGTFDGGKAPGSDFTEAEMLVDWVRVYR